MKFCNGQLDQKSSEFALQQQTGRIFAVFLGERGCFGFKYYFKLSSKHKMRLTDSEHCT